MKKVVFPWLIATEDAMNSYNEHAPQMTHISPTWYSMKADLSIDDKSDQTVAALAREKGCKLVPLIVNEKFSVDVAHSILGTAQSRSAAAKNIAQLVIDNKYDGINMDFEGPFVADRDNYSKFIAELRGLLPSDKEISVDVVPQHKPPTLEETPSKEKELDKWIQAWREPFDYKTLGQSVSHFILMGYDYSGRLSAPGPVAPYFWLKDIVEYTLKHMPAEKIVLGLPLYGRHWIISDGERSEGMATDALQTRVLVAERNLQVFTDEKSLTRSITWQEDEKKHVAYYDDSETLREKMKLVNEYGLAGVAFWRLGTEEPEVWKTIEELLS